MPLIVVLCRVSHLNYPIASLLYSYQFDTFSLTTNHIRTVLPEPRNYGMAYWCAAFHLCARDNVVKLMYSKSLWQILRAFKILFLLCYFKLATVI